MASIYPTTRRLSRATRLSGPERLVTTRLHTLLIAAPGLESLVCAEAERLVGGAWKTTPGGVEGWVETPGLVRLAAQHRTGDGLRVRIGRFTASTFDALIDGARRVPWHAWIPRDAAVRVRARCSKSKLYHSGAVEERVAAVLAEGGRASADDGTAVHLRLHQDKVVVRVDALDRPMHHRGYRTAVGRAPLRESLAAACIDAARADLDAATAIVDPFVGSGTLLAEAALAIGGRPVRTAPFGFEAWPSWSAPEGEAASEVEGASAAPSSLPILIGSDRSAHELDNVRANLGRLGVEAALSSADIADAMWPEGAVLVCNPPWGTRSGRDDARATLKRLGDALRAGPRLRAAWVLLPGDGALARVAGLGTDRVLTFDDRGRRVAWYRWTP